MTRQIGPILTKNDPEKQRGYKRKMSIFKKKHKHYWEYPDLYTTGATRVCKTCGERQVFQEVHYGTWEITKNHGEKNGKTLDKTILWWYDSR